MLSAIVGYFDLVQSLRPVAGEDFSALADNGIRKLNPNLILVLQYAALFAGILAKKWFDHSESANDAQFFTLGTAIASAIVATCLFPAVYKKTMKPQEEALPTFVQLCTVFTTGVGYKTMMDAVPL